MEIKLMIAAFMAILAISLASAIGMEHNASDINVVINGHIINLEAAYVMGYFGGPSAPTSDMNAFEGRESTYRLGAFHENATDFVVKMGSHKMNIQEAINGDFFNKDASADMQASGLHDATDIVFSNGRTFQELFDSGEMSCKPTSCEELGKECETWDNNCGSTVNCGGCAVGVCSGGECVGVCTPGTTRKKDCDYLDNNCRNYNDVMQTCGSNGYWNSAPCDSYTNSAFKTSCGTEAACDGEACGYRDAFCNYYGKCSGWSGSGCQTCPLGDDHSGCDYYCTVPTGYISNDGYADDEKCYDMSKLLWGCVGGEKRNWDIWSEYDGAVIIQETNAPIGIGPVAPIGIGPPIGMIPVIRA